MLNRALTPRRVLAGSGIVAAALASSSSSSSSTPRPVRAHYLRPDHDELPLLGRMRRDMLLQNVHFSWGEALPTDLKAVEVLITRLPEPQELAALPALEKVIVPFAGPTEVTKDNVREASAQRQQAARDGSPSSSWSSTSSPPLLALHNCHFDAASTAELAVTLLLAAVKNVAHHDATLRAEAAGGTRPWTTGWAPGYVPLKSLPNFITITIAMPMAGWTRTVVLFIVAVYTRLKNVPACFP